MIELKTDSRKVKPGDTFIAIKNVNTDGHDFHSGCNACNAFAIISRGSDNTGNLCAVISV